MCPHCQMRSHVPAESIDTGDQIIVCKPHVRLLACLCAGQLNSPSPAQQHPAQAPPCCLAPDPTAPRNTDKNLSTEDQWMLSGIVWESLQACPCFAAEQTGMSSSRVCTTVCDLQAVIRSKALQLTGYTWMRLSRLGRRVVVRARVTGRVTLRALGSQCSGCECECEFEWHRQLDRVVFTKI